MITKKMVIEFHEQRLKSTNGILDKLYALRDNNLVTRSIDSEITMQEGEREFIIDTLLFIKADTSKNDMFEFTHGHRLPYYNDISSESEYYKTECGENVPVFHKDR